MEVPEHEGEHLHQAGHLPHLEHHGCPELGPDHLAQLEEVVQGEAEEDYGHEDGEQVG